MGLDIVEVIMCSEDSFKLDLKDSSGRTVGDLFEAICSELKLPSGSSAPQADGITVPRVLPPKGGWTRETVWVKLVEICTDQPQVPSDEITYKADFVNDLGAD
jgi:hypothetical protein